MTTHAEPPSRNAPCPCGSGLKYKRCCLARDRAAATGISLLAGGGRKPRSDLLDLAGEPAVPDGGIWQMELVPIRIIFDDDAAARPVIALVIGSGLALSANPIARGPNDIDGVAAALESALDSARKASGATPAMVDVRFAEVGAALRVRLRSQGIAVRVRPRLPELDKLASNMNAEVYGDDGLAPTGSAPQTWAGWGLAADQIATLFAAAARFHRAAPWAGITNPDVMHAHVNGRSWSVMVLGNAGQEFGLALYSEASDIDRLFALTPVPGKAFTMMRGFSVVMLFQERDDLPPAMRQEVRRAGWEIAGRSAYPVLAVLNTPAGAVSSDKIDDLIGLLEAVARLSADGTAGDVLAKTRLPSGWSDRASGVTLWWAGVRVTLPWPLPRWLELSGPQGAGARPTALYASQDEVKVAGKAAVTRVVLGFAEWLTARRFARPGKMPPLNPTVLTITEFLGFLIGGCRIPPAGVTEADLRHFLYVEYPEKFARPRVAGGRILEALRLLFEYLEEREQIVCPWAREPLANRSAFLERIRSFPGTAADEEVVNHWKDTLELDLEARVLVPVALASGSIRWDELDAETEMRLARELARGWLVWRDEVIRLGATDPDEVQAVLVARREEWEASISATS